MIKRQGISIPPTIGIGDQIQFSSLPENYYYVYNELLVDVSNCWIFDHNPFVDRYIMPNGIKNLWDHSVLYKRNRVLDGLTYLSNAHRHAELFEIKNPILIRPRLYRFEGYPFHSRSSILLHTEGNSHGQMPTHILDHIVEKYSPELIQIGLVCDDRIPNIPWLKAENMWDLVSLISTARMVIGMDSGPTWIAACYPDIIVKKIRMKPMPDKLESWIPLEINNIHSHWDDRAFMIYNPTENDLGCTWSYRKI